MEWTSKTKQRVAIAVAVVLLLVVAAVVCICWYFSSVLITPDHKVKYSDTVISATKNTVVLKRSNTTEEQGIYGLYWSGGGHAIIGEIISQSSDRVVRRLGDRNGPLAPGTKVDVGANVYQGNPRQAVRLPFKPVKVRTDLGPAPAWFVPGRSSTWAIFVHGIDANRMSGLKLLPTLHRLGMPVLDITYRNDIGAPRSPDGKIHLGATEWHDLDSAVKYAKAHGARQIVPVGMSMGGAIVTEFMRNSRNAEIVPRMVLDAPALDWSPILDLAASEIGLPKAFVGLVEVITEARIDIDFASLDQISHAHDFKVPILILHGSDDKVVPVSVSERFAAALPKLVQLHIFPGAGHIESWNTNHRRYDSYLARFLSTKFF